MQFESVSTCQLRKTLLNQFHVAIAPFCCPESFNIMWSGLRHKDEFRREINVHYGYACEKREGLTELPLSNPHSERIHSFWTDPIIC